MQICISHAKIRMIGAIICLLTRMTGSSEDMGS